MKPRARLAASALLLGLVGTAPAQLPPACLRPEVNVGQAKTFLAYLDGVASKTATAAQIEAVLKQEGTELLIAQQNIARRVTAQQYRELLKSLVEKTSKEIAPVDTDQRSRRGIEGLTRDILPSLHWGVENVGLLQARLQALERADVIAAAKKRSDNALPETVATCPRLFIVMGGRAGAAALDNGRIYFDLLITSYRSAARDQPPPTVSLIETFFAHELHHIALETIIGRKRKQLKLNPKDEKIFNFLQTIVAEGSATYFINANRDIDQLRSDPEYAAHLADENALLLQTSEAARALLTASEIDDARYQEITAGLLGAGWHSVGAVMFSVIEKQLGTSEAFEVMRDPRRLLTVYNRATATDKTSSHFRFDPSLTTRLASLGSE